MNAVKFAAIIVALGVGSVAYSEGGAVNISSPAEGAKVALTAIKLAYDVAPGTKGDHLHIYIDGEQVAVLHQLKGNYTVDKLTAGKHWLCIRVIDKGNTPVGLEKCVGVLAGNVPPMGY